MKQTKYQGNYISVTEEDINGHIYERVTLREGVHVIPVQNNKVLLMREYRTHERAPRWKLVSGWCDKKGKTPLEHAKEELAEEVGMEASHWQEAHRTDISHATINPRTYYFVCREIKPLQHKVNNPDNSKVLEQKWFSYQELFDLMNRNEIWLDHSLMVAVWLLFNEHQKNEA